MTWWDSYALLLYLGLATLLFSVFLFFQSKLNQSLFWLCIAGLLFRVVVSLDPFLHFWDECFHALVAKNLLQHPLVPTLYDRILLPLDSEKWFYSHIWLHKPPLSTWGIAASFTIFGVNEFSVRIPSILLSTISILVTFHIAKSITDSHTAWLAAFFQTINGFIIEITGGRIATDHVDVFFMFFIQLGVFFAVKQRETQKLIYILPLSISIACAIYSKWLPALIVVPIWIFLIKDLYSVKSIIFQIAIVLAVILILVVPWQLYIFSVFPIEAKRESDYNWLHVTSQLEGHHKPWYFFILEATIKWSEFIWVGIAFIVYRAFSQHGKKQKETVILLLIWILIPYVFFTLVQTKMPAYILITAPAMFISLSIFWFDLNKLAKESISSFRVIARIVQVFLILLSIRYAIERLKPFQKNEAEIQNTASIKALNSRFPDSQVVFFNTRYSMQIMFYTDALSYDRLPTDEDLSILKAKGYKVVVFDSPSLPDVLRKNKDIQIMAL